MRFLALEAVFSLIVLVAPPLFGCGRQAHAGLICPGNASASADFPLLNDPATENDRRTEDEPRAGCFIGALDDTTDSAGNAVAAWAEGQTLLERLLGSAYLALVGIGSAWASGEPAPEPPGEQVPESLCFAERTEVPPACSASRLLSHPRLYLPDPPLPGLYRPPRG
jgi:hypothetical protein